MALGGGTFTAQNKVLPGTYINFVSNAAVETAISSRGVAAMPMQLNWGKESAVMDVTAEAFYKDSVKLFGYAADADELLYLREIFRNATRAYIYRVNGGGAKAGNTYADAKYGGTRGNQLTIVVADDPDTEGAFIVKTLLAGDVKDTQKVAAATALKANDYVTFKTGATLVATTGLNLSGGTNAVVTGESYSTALSAFESYAFNALGCPSADASVQTVFKNYTKRLRDEMGVKFQCVLPYSATGADYEGDIQYVNSIIGSVDTTTALVYWLTGAEAGCAVNESLTNTKYDGELTISADYTQAQLETYLTEGYLVFHRVGTEYRVLRDINSLVTYTVERSKDFTNNQTIRVLDQIATDVAVIFNTTYLGKVPNTESGRISLKNDVIKHHQALEAAGAIEGFDPSVITVAQGDSKTSVVMTDAVTPINAMDQLYMTVLVA